jgi:hypothetical protein
MPIRGGWLLLIGSLLAVGPGGAAELKKETIDAFDRYVAAAEERLQPRFRGDHFLWSDDVDSQRQQVSQGTVVIEPAQNRGITEIKGGLIHDWMGAVLIRPTTLAKTLSVVQDYARHVEIYRPEVARAGIRSRHGNDFDVSMRIVKSKLFLTDVLNTEQEIRFVPIDGRRIYSRAYSTRIAEVTDAGKSNEHELPPGKDRGLLWRMIGYWFFEERDGGVYVECEAISLTRDVPLGMGKIFGPIVRSMPAESLRISLEHTRSAVAASSGDSP